MNWVYIVAGGLLLVFGRKLFWLFVAMIGFLIGMMYIPELLPEQPDQVILTISLIAGLLGALLSVLLQKFAVGLAGLIAGGYVAYYLLENIVTHVGDFQWLAILAGALAGAVLAGSMYDWALILITSASGAVTITQYLPISMPVSIVILLVLFFTGLVVQGRIKVKE
jgi:hypothetical protein